MKYLRYMIYGFLLIAISIFGYMKITNKNTSELGLDIFSWIKKVKGENVQMEKMIPSKLKSLDHSDWTGLLSKFVTLDGHVNYRGMVKSKSRLDQYLNYLSENPPASDWTKNEKLAYWINAYNAFTVKLIVDNHPLESIKDISDGLPMIDSPWDIKFFKIGGVDFDLNTIEHEILRKQFDEPRIHFAINCASISCPKLRHEAYLTKYLEFQLEDQAKAFINDKTKNQINNSETKLSGIFNWFKGDFTKKESLHSFLNKYNKEIKEENSISFLEYNWALNK